MPPFQIATIAVALALDAFAVAVATGVMLKTVGPRQAFRLSWHFGLFQALMPVIGWSAGLGVRGFMMHYAHWVAFGLLLLIGGNMIRSAWWPSGGGVDAKTKDPTRGITLVFLSIATSIDALAVGFSISLLRVSIWVPAAVIGMVACGFTLAGLRIGRTLGGMPRIGRFAETLGGVALIVIGFHAL